MAFDSTERIEAYRFFAIAFGAAPGVTHYRDIEAAYANGAPTKQIVNEFAKKGPFQSVYPNSASDAEFALSLVANVVGDAATFAAKQEAVLDIVLALRGGATRGDVVYQIFTNLAGLRGDQKWGALAAKLDKQVEVAKFYTEVLKGESGTLEQLRSVISGVDAATDVSDAALRARLGKLTATGLTGKIIDGYVRGATVFVDYNGNGEADTEQERQTLTNSDEKGNYSLVAPLAGGILVARGGVNIDTGNANTLVLKAPAVVSSGGGEAARNLTPITTLVTEVAAASSGGGGAALTQKDLERAEASVKQTLGLTNVSASILSLDPIAVASSTSASTEDKAAALNLFKVGIQVALVSAAAQSSSDTAAGKQAAAQAAVSALVSKIVQVAATLPPAGTGGTTGGTTSTTPAAPAIDLSKAEVITQVLATAKVEVKADVVQTVATASTQIAAAVTVSAASTQAGSTTSTLPNTPTTTPGTTTNTNTNTNTSTTNT